MDERNILDVLSEGSGSFSKRQRNVAKYILENCEKVAFMTAEMLSKEANVSESTVVRFAVQLGYDNFPNMRKAIQQVLRGRLTKQREQEPNGGKHSPEEVFLKSLAESEASLRTLNDEDNRLFFDGITQTIERCGKIYIIGGGGKAPLADYLALQLELIRGGVRLCRRDEFAELQSIERGDVLLCIASANSFGAEIRFAKDRGADTFLICDGVPSQERRYADHTITVGNTMAVMGFIEALIAALADAEGKSVKAISEQIELIRAEYEEYGR